MASDRRKIEERRKKKKAEYIMSMFAVGTVSMLYVVGIFVDSDVNNWENIPLFVLAAACVAVFL